MDAEADRIEAELLGFSFCSDDGGFAVTRVRISDGSIATAVGPLGHVTEGQHLVLTGRWTTHRQFGRQFRVLSVLIEDPRTLRGLERYLGSGAVRGLGPEMARRLVNHFGLQTLNVIDNEPQRLREVKGIGRKRAERILTHWAEDRALREVFASLRGFGIGQALSKKIVDRFGPQTMGIVQRQPYRLCREIRGVGFRTADAIAREANMPLDAPERAEAGLLHLLSQAEGDGHCFLPQAELLRQMAVLEIPEKVATQSIDRLLLQGILSTNETANVSPGRPIYRAEMAQLEAWIAQWIRHRLKADQPSPARVNTRKAEEQLGLQLSQDQRRAVVQCFDTPVTTLTGGPGTGKTTIVQVILALAAERNERWLLAAPTGRAARRLGESANADGKTIHRLLEFNAHTGLFQRDASNPLVADGVLIEEASMIDVPLMASLTAAIPDDCRLVLVGDADQLPSVGPGKILGDMVSCGTVPVATLSKVYRQAGHSGIVRNAHRINQGERPISGERDDSQSTVPSDFFVVHRTDPLEAQATILEVVLRRLPSLGFDPLQDVQVLTPMHNGPLGTEALNHHLQRLLDAGPTAAEIGERKFRVGDRVMQTRNDYDQDIFNGDTGRIVSARNGILDVSFDGRVVQIDGDGIRNLSLAYALSIHKSQGSEYPAVVVVLHRAHRIMLRRNLLYTALTRARRFCCLIGDPWAIEQAIEHQGGAERWTLLARRISR